MWDESSSTIFNLLTRYAACGTVLAERSSISGGTPPVREVQRRKHEQDWSGGENGKKTFVYPVSGGGPAAGGGAAPSVGERRKKFYPAHGGTLAGGGSQTAKGSIKGRKKKILLASAGELW